MNKRRALPLLLALTAVSACASPTYVNTGEEAPATLGFNEVVFDVKDAYKAAPPDCVAILPLAVKTPARPEVAPEDRAKVRLALYAQLATRSKREIPLARVDQAAAEAKGDRKALGEHLGCAALLEGEVTEYGSAFYGIYSRVAVGTDLRMIRAADGALLWEGHHVAVSHGGSIPIDPLSIAWGVADAASNIRDEQILRVTDDLARRLVSTIPDDQPALASGQVAEPAAEGKAINAEAWFVKGRMLMQAGDLSGAESVILKAVALDRGNAKYLDALGAVNERKGAGERALAAYRMAIDADPADGFAWYNSAVIEFNTGNPEAAADAFYRAGLAYMKTGNLAEAEQALARLRDLENLGMPVTGKIQSLDGAVADLTRRQT